MATQAQLDDARAKYHQLQTGRAAVSVTREGKSVSFQAADAAKLANYIVELETALGVTSTRRGRPARLS